MVDIFRRLSPEALLVMLVILFCVSLNGVFGYHLIALSQDLTIAPKHHYLHGTSV